VARDKKKSGGDDREYGKESGASPFALSAAVTIFVMGVYLLTLSPGVSWAHHSEDSGDLISAAWVAGIPHPTGYPLFCMLGWLWSHIIRFGHVAWRMNAFSGLWGALASGIMVRCIWRSLSLLPSDTFAKLTRFDRSLASVSGGLLLGLSTYAWQQSVITEVYTLNLFFMTLVTWVLIELLAGAREAEESRVEVWAVRRERLVMALGLSWGFALTNHMTSLLLFAGIITTLAFGNLGLRSKEFLKGALCWAVPLLCYLYLPIRSAMNPPLDYGNPQTWDGFVWMVTGKQFKKIMFSLVPYMSLFQIMRYDSLPLQLGNPGALASVLGLVKLGVWKSRGMAILLAHSFFLVASALFFLASYSIWDPEGYVLSMNVAASIWAGWSVALAAGLPDRYRRVVKALVVILLIVAPIGALVGHWKDCDLSGDREAMQFGEESFAAFEPNAVAIEFRYERAFALWYYREVEYANTRQDVEIVYMEHMIFQWGLDLSKRKYPDLIVPDTPMGGMNPAKHTAAWIIRHNIDRHPIYTGAIVDELEQEGYRFEAVGLMYRVFPPGE
jgi:hypothetical protein